MSAHPAIKRSQIIVYGLPQLAIAYLVLGIVNFTPAFYAAEMGISMLAISGLMLSSRFLDVVTDPLIGMLSDRTQSRYGRRKPWIVAGVPVLMLGMWLLFNPNPGASEQYFFIAISVLFFGLTMIQLPYIAWGAELSPDYDERTRITSVRERIGALGSIAALATAMIMATVFEESRLGPVLEIMTLALFALIPLLLGLALWKIPSPTPVLHQQQHTGFFAGAKVALSNSTFRRFALGVFLLFFGLMPGGALGWFLFDDILGRTDLFAAIVLAEFVASFIGLPLWTRYAERTSKHRASVAALLWCAVFTGLIPFAEPMGIWVVVGLLVTRSLALGALLMLPFSMIADVIDMDRAETGEQRTGIYMAFGGIIIKMAITIGVASSLAIPGGFGFDPAAETNSELALNALLGTYGWLAAATFIMAAWVFKDFPLTREKLEQIQRTIRQQQASADDHEACEDIMEMGTAQSPGL